MKKVLSFIAGSLLALTAAADTANPRTFTASQPDGTTLTLRMVGDEHFHYFVDVKTGRQMERDSNGNYVPMTSEKYSRLATAAAINRTAINKIRGERLTAHQQAAGIGTTPDAIVNGRAKAPGTFNGALTGTRRGLVILVNFNGSSYDLPYEFSTTHEDWENAFNQVGYDKNNAIGSVHDYFYDQSYGNFDLEFDVVGPVTVSYKLEYYGKNNSYGNDAKPYSMVVEACKLVNSEVDFKNYDWDGDGEVDQVYVIYAGYGESSGADANTIWPHENVLSRTPYGTRLRLDNVYVNTYGCSNELCGTSGNEQTGIGTACHEFSHCIGFPDFYDIDYSGGFGMDALDIMCNGGHSGPNYNGEVPYGYTAYERWMAGWLTPKVLDKPTAVEGMKNLADEPEAYIIYNDGKKDEYFLLENHKADGWYRYCGNFPGTDGMIVTHVDFDQQVWTYNQPNDDPSHQRMTIIPAGGSYGTYYDKSKSWFVSKSDFASFPFPGSKHVRALTNESHYDCGGKLWNLNKDKTRHMNKSITEIEENLADGTVSFLFMADTDDGSRRQVTFDAGDGTTTTLSATQQAASERIILPAATPTNADVHFVGWSASSVTPTSERPADLMPAGTAYLPLADVTLHAVYAHSPMEAIGETYRPATTLKKGGKYVFTNRNTVSATDLACLSAAGLKTDAYTKDYAPTDISFTGESTTITDPADDCTWMVKTFDDELVLYNGTRYLDLNSTDGMKLADAPVYIGWDNKYGLYCVKSGSTTKYYLRVQSGKFTFSKTASASARLYAFELTIPTDGVTYFTHSPAGISSVLAPSAADAIYDISGRRISANGAHGVSIAGGKKILR